MRPVPAFVFRLCALSALWVIGAPGAWAVPICRWTDDNGRVQISDVVPEAYARIAVCTVSGQHELTPAQQREAADRARAELARAEAQAGAPAPTPAPVRDARDTRDVPASDARRPRQRVTEATDCVTWRRLYDESNACFGPYRTTRGATRPEAFDHCNVVPSPEPKCGLPRD